MRLCFGHPLLTRTHEGLRCVLDWAVRLLKVLALVDGTMPVHFRPRCCLTTTMLTTTMLTTTMLAGALAIVEWFSESNALSGTIVAVFVGDIGVVDWHVDGCHVLLGGNGGLQLGEGRGVDILSERAAIGIV